MTHRMGAIGDSQILQHKVPRNKKYESVSSRLDTGASVNRYLKRIEDMQTNYRYKKNEIFKRMKVTTFAQLAIQVANVSMNEEDDISEINTARTDLTLQDVNSNSPRSTLEEVVRGVGEVDLKEPLKLQEDTPEYLAKPYVDSPYLLCDVRDLSDYDECHITTAISFPRAMLSRTMNNFTPQILRYKNCPGKIIILYDEDERNAIASATTMVERGFENVFILSGGLKVLAQKIPEGLTNGSLPNRIVPDYIAKQMKPGRRRNGTREHIQDNSNAYKHRFSSTDLDLVNHYLEESLIPQDTGSRLSRLSSTSSNRTYRSTRSTTGSSYTNISTDRKPWK